LPNEFCVVVLRKNDVTWYLENRRDKYQSRRKYTNLWKSRAEILRYGPSSNTNCPNQPSEGEAWFSGFVEAEGCFSIQKITRRVKAAHTLPMPPRPAFDASCVESTKKGVVRFRGGLFWVKNLICIYCKVFCLFYPVPIVVLCDKKMKVIFME